jgi:Sec-independent protein secretion pathway component TatC
MFKKSTHTQKLYQYHSLELKVRLFYIILMLGCTFFISFLHMEYILYKFSLLNFVEKFNTNLNFKILNQTNQNKLLDVKTDSAGKLSENYTINNIDLQHMEYPEITQYTENINQIPGFIFTEIFEAFFSYLTFSGYISFLCCLPLIYYHLYKFILPGLSFSEKNLLKYFFSLSFFLISLAHILTYNLVIPYATSFFLNFQSSLTALGESTVTSTDVSSFFMDFISKFNFKQKELAQGLFEQVPESIYVEDQKKVNFNSLTFLGRIYPWITFLINLFTIISFLFQVPLFLFTSFILFTKLKNHTKKSKIQQKTHNLTFFSGNTYLTNTKLARKVLFFILLLLTAVFSPPDLYSQFILFVPLFVVVEIFIFTLCMYIEYLDVCVCP